MDYFDANARWYKGNLHTHTTRSDGKLDVEACIERYRQAGYDFLALTDHRIYGPPMERDNFVVLSGEEFNREDYTQFTAYHILGIGHDSEIPNSTQLTPQEIIDGIRARGGMVIMGHPSWSLMSAQEIGALSGIDAIEGYSGISDAYSSRGDSMNITDVLTTQGCRFHVVAVDDMHFNARDFGRGFIRVQADSLTQQGILDALRAGRFYSSQGPEIRQIRFDGQTLKAEFSPVKRISIMSNSWWVKDRVRLAEGETLLTDAEYTVKPNDRWLRVEAEDEQGRMCWSNYIFLDRDAAL